MEWGKSHLWDLMSYLMRTLMWLMGELLSFLKRMMTMGKGLPEVICYNKSVSI